MILSGGGDGGRGNKREWNVFCFYVFFLFHTEHLECKISFSSFSLSLFNPQIQTYCTIPILNCVCLAFKLLYQHD